MERGEGALKVGRIEIGELSLALRARVSRLRIAPATRPTLGDIELVFGPSDISGESNSGDDWDVCELSEGRMNDEREYEDGVVLVEEELAENGGIERS